MKLKGKFEFIGLEKFQGRKDVTKEYHSAVLMQNTDVVKVFLNDDSVPLFKDCKKMDVIECELDIKVNKDNTFIGVDSVKKVS